MKKYPGILKRAELVEWRSGKIYAKPDGSLFKSLFRLSALAMLYTFFINLFYILGLNVMYKDTPEYKELVWTFVAIATSNLFLIAAFVLMKLKLRIISNIVSIIPSLFLLVFFALITKATAADNGFLGLKTIYYWRHFIPLFLILGCAVFMIVIILRAKHKFNLVYKETEDQLYSLYKEIRPESTEEDWIEFAESYDGESPQKLFGKKKKGKSTKSDAEEKPQEK